MRKICAWCGKPLELPSAFQPGDGRVSHGICPECFDFLVENDRGSLAAFLDRLPIPVLLVDEQRRVIIANERARQAFPGAAWSGTPGVMLLGDMIECAFARLPLGCGMTIHCAACQVRASVSFTSLSGQSSAGVEAFREVQTPAGLVRQRMRVSTDRLGETVLVRLELLDGDPGEPPGS